MTPLRSKRTNRLRTEPPAKSANGGFPEAGLIAIRPTSAALKLESGDRNVAALLRLSTTRMELDMKTLKAFGVAALLASVSTATPSIAQEVITNPGKCAQYYPNANCSNYGPGNPYRGPYSYQRGWRNGYAWAPSYGWRRHHHSYWR
jgi:hypothetical protein